MSKSKLATVAPCLMPPGDEPDRTTALPTLLIKPSAQRRSFVMVLGDRKGPPHQVWSAGPETAPLVASAFLAAVYDTPVKALGDMLMIYSNALYLEPGRLSRISDFIAWPSGVRL